MNVFVCMLCACTSKGLCVCVCLCLCILGDEFFLMNKMNSMTCASVYMYLFAIVKLQMRQNTAIKYRQTTVFFILFNFCDIFKLFNVRNKQKFTAKKKLKIKESEREKRMCVFLCKRSKWKSTFAINVYNARLVGSATISRNQLHMS